MIQLSDGTVFNHCFCYMDKNKTCTHNTIDLKNLAPVEILEKTFSEQPEHEQKLQKEPKQCN